jgi:protein gp37
MTKIEWTDKSKNPIKGVCPVYCDYCYARDFYDRFKWDPEPHFEPKVLDEIKHMKKPKKIFICSTFEIFHPIVKPEWLKKILETIEACPQHIFQILTKLPHNIPQDIVFPENLWIGVSITKNDDWWRIEWLDNKITFSKNPDQLKFISFEPMFEDMQKSFNKKDLCTDYKWLIIGGLTGRKQLIPPKEWIDYIINWGKDTKTAVFVKNNCHYKEKIQEFPCIPF